MPQSSREASAAASFCSRANMFRKSCSGKIRVCIKSLTTQIGNPLVVVVVEIDGRSGIAEGAGALFSAMQ